MNTARWSSWRRPGLAERVAAWDEAMLVTALQALPGVDLVSAATLVAEVGDFRRFASASELMT